MYLIVSQCCMKLKSNAAVLNCVILNVMPFPLHMFKVTWVDNFFNVGKQNTNILCNRKSQEVNRSRTKWYCVYNHSCWMKFPVCVTENCRSVPQEVSTEQLIAIFICIQDDCSSYIAVICLGLFGSYIWANNTGFPNRNQYRPMSTTKNYITNAVHWRRQPMHLIPMWVRESVSSEKMIKTSVAPLNKIQQTHFYFF